MVKQREIKILGGDQFPIATLSKVTLRRWSQELHAQFTNDLDMQESVQLFSCVERGIEGSINQFFTDRGKAPPVWKWPVADNQQRTFGTSTTANGVRDRMTFTFDWLQKFTDALTDETQLDILATIRATKFDHPEPFSADGCLRMRTKIDMTLLGVDMTVVDQKELKDTVIKCLPEGMRGVARRGGHTGESWHELLSRLTVGFSEASKHAELLQASMPVRMQTCLACVRRGIT